jgi:Xaa-Pro aminopeptidase
MNSAALDKLRRWMEAQGFPRFAVSTPANFAWLTGGDNTVVTNQSAAWLEVEPAAVILCTSAIEASRLREEELDGPGAQLQVWPWHHPAALPSPNDLEHDLTALRLVLSPGEQDQLRELGRDCARLLGDRLRAAHPELSERQLAGQLASQLMAEGIRPLVLLVAGERRVFRYRHPLPKAEPLGRLALVGLCGQRAGLIVSVSRLRSFGHPGAAARNAVVLEVERAALELSRPGKTLGEVARAMRAAYQERGYPEAFEEHHQGGLGGYRTREVLATPQQPTRLEAGMVVAWNPSLPGAKVEDSFLIGQHGLEELTTDPAWPSTEVGGRRRPLVLE